MLLMLWLAGIVLTLINIAIFTKRRREDKAINRFEATCGLIALEIDSIRDELDELQDKPDSYLGSAI